MPRPWPLPAKLVKKILDLEYVEIADLVPDNWQYIDEEQSKCCHQAKRPRKGQIVDILLWVECFSFMIEVLATHYPHKVSELMAYQRTVVRAQRTFAGEGWVTYDTCFRRKAAATKSLDWGQVDFTLYNETFTGRAKALSRCKFCSSEHHTSVECQFAPDARSGKRTSPKQSGYSGYSKFESNRPSSNVCHLFNHRAGNKCRFNPCKFFHNCTECGGDHPASQCRPRPQQNKLARGESPGGKGRN
jgi:hypothetical protein